MNEILVKVAVAVGTSFVGLLTWLMVAMVKHSTNSGLHQTTAEKAAVEKSIEARFKAADERFHIIEKMLEEMRQDIKTLLRRRK
jgi:hypothetical protein